MDNHWEEEIKRVLVKEVNPHFIIVFGSYAKGNERPDSDLDLAYTTDKPLSAYENFLIAQQLADILKVEVDLIDIREVDTVFAAQIFSTGELIYCGNENIYILERMKALSMYVQLNDYRADLLDQIDERGQIYEK